MNPCLKRNRGKRNRGKREKTALRNLLRRAIG